MTSARTAWLPAPFGGLSIAADDVGLVRVAVDATPGPEATNGLLREASDRLAAWLLDPGVALDLPLTAQGTPLQRAVWEALASVPVGETTTYGALAARLGRGPGSARAIGAAVGANPWLVVVPCHRVVGAGGAITGYAGGVAVKRWLLRHEAPLWSAPSA